MGVKIDSVLVFTEFVGGFYEVVAGNSKAVAATKDEVLAREGISAAFGAGREEVAVGGGVAIVRKSVVRSVSKEKGLVVVVINCEEAAGEGVCDGAFCAGIDRGERS